MTSPTDLAEREGPVCSCPPSHKHYMMLDDGPPKAALLVCGENDCPNIECLREEAE